MPRSLPLVLLALGGALSGCTPKIGDECASSIDCSQQGERLCDTTQKDGYCTIFNCEPDTCPEDEAVCVAFDFRLDQACQGANDTDWARFGRTFCMAVCEDDGDCRDGYECANPDDMLIIDDPKTRAGDKYCIQKAPAPATPTASVPPICSPDAGDVDLDAFVPDGGTAGTGGTGGTGGTAGAGGTGGSVGGGGQGGAGGAGGVSGGGGTGG